MFQPLGLTITGSILLFVFYSIIIKFPVSRTHSKKAYKGISHKLHIFLP
jgi:hypothetical protein